jgi:cell division protein FtsL
MAKLAALLIGILLTASLLLVTSQHRARKAFIELERAQATARKHEVQWSQLQLEQTRLAKHSLIDSVARRDLKMQSVTPDRTIFVAAPANAPAVSVPATSAPVAAAPGAPRAPERLAEAREAR